MARPILKQACRMPYKGTDKKKKKKLQTTEFTNVCTKGHKIARTTLYPSPSPKWTHKENQSSEHDHCKEILLCKMYKLVEVSNKILNKCL